MRSKTIAAVSTPPGVGGISVIRMSGAEAVKIADRVFCGAAELSNVPTHTVHYGHIQAADGRLIDEVLVTVMRAPKSFTREDVVEISTHGGIQASRLVLEELIKAGAVPAEPGEFTKRAFLNGRIDLSQAEAVIDIINAKSEYAHRNALSQAGGGLSHEINRIRSELVALAAAMQVIIDYPDEELEDVTNDDIRERAARSAAEVQDLIDTFNSGRIIKNGIVTAIIGKPNVGKSSLLNRMARSECAIVTDIAGTTRDVIREQVDFNGIPLVLTDTAGIRETDDAVEKIGVERSHRAIEEADLIIFMLDSTTALNADERQLLEETSGRKRIILVNKSDLAAPRLGSEPLLDGAIAVSAATGEGMELLENKIREMYSLGIIGADSTPIVTNMRQLAALTRAHSALERVAGAIEDGMPADIASIDLNEAINSLGEITGAVASEDIVEAVFHDFCVGK